MPASPAASDAPSATASEPAGVEVEVELNEWAVNPMPDTVAAGTIELNAVNTGQAR